MWKYLYYNLNYTLLVNLKWQQVTFAILKSTKITCIYK